MIYAAATMQAKATRRRKLRVELVAEAAHGE